MVLCLLVVNPFQKVHASTSFETIIHYVSSGEYEEGVTLLNNWFIENNYEQQEVLSQSYRELITILSKTQTTHDKKLIKLWSFISLAEYVTQNRTDYTRFLAMQLEKSWLEYDQTPSNELLNRMEQFYSAMLPTLQLMVERGDHTMMASIDESISEPSLLLSSNHKTLPVFNEWYKEQNEYSTLIIVSFLTGVIVISSLIYVSWRKYDGEVRRKKIRDHND